MPDPVAFFVQLPHPGGEHNPSTDEMPWNTNDHRRKFLVGPGRYLDADQGSGEAQLAFWGEWEAQSRIERRWPRSDRMPRALHRPYWREPTTTGFRQNTDPWVFGERMIYSNCKQLTGQKRRSTSMQHLSRGSVVCFGSTIQARFCIDTLFVVASAEPWVPAAVAELEVDEAFRICTAHSVATGGRVGQVPLVLYRGATFDDPVEGMFSFVPARHAELDDPRFMRPAVESRFINPSSRQSTWGSRRPLPIDVVREAWGAIRRQVVDAGLLLATRLTSPDRELGETIDTTEAHGGREFDDNSTHQRARREAVE